MQHISLYTYLYTVIYSIISIFIYPYAPFLSLYILYQSIFSSTLSFFLLSIWPYFLYPTLFSLSDLIFSIWPYFVFLTLFSLFDLIVSFWPYFIYPTLISVFLFLYICPAMILCLSITLPWLNNLFTSVIARVNSLTENWYIFNLITQILYLRQQR